MWYDGILTLDCYSLICHRHKHSGENRCFLNLEPLWWWCLRVSLAYWKGTIPRPYTVIQRWIWLHQQLSKLLLMFIYQQNSKYTIYQSINFYRSIYLQSPWVTLLFLPILLMADRMSLRRHASVCDRVRETVLSVRKYFCLSVSTAGHNKRLSVTYCT